MYRPKRWHITPDHPQAQQLAERLKISPVVAQALLNRDLADPTAASAFLQPKLTALAAPHLLPGATQAAARIAEAIRNREKIVVYGDYDVDGITATSILWHAITLLGGIVRTYIPHRIDEGYGLGADALSQIIDDGANVIITVDCGITAADPARIARQRNIDLIITDHHEWHEGQPLPDCHTIVHPRLPRETAYPNPHLCGAGVAFKLAWAIGQATGGAERVDPAFRNFLVEATALAALGTIADVVPLIGENRALAHFGLNNLKQSKLTGIRALIESASLTGQNLNSTHVGFLLAPRLNACGRLGHAALAVEMLTTATFERATEIAAYLESQNRERQSVERAIFEQAVELVEKNHWDTDDGRALVLGSEGWHAGVIGIVASRLVERFGRPTVMIALDNGHGQGSARSIEGFHLARALAACTSHLDSHGGHEMAAGLRLQTARLDVFRVAFREFAASRITPEMLQPRLNLEGIVQIPQLTTAVVEDLARLGPFGQKNPRPLWCIEKATVAAVPRRVGRPGEHLQLTVSQNGVHIKCIAFQMAELFDRFSVGCPIDLAVEPDTNDYTGRPVVELKVKDIRFPISN